MYVIKVDGAVMYSPDLQGMEHQVLNPQLQLEVNRAGSLTFVLPPGHAMRDAIHRMKSIITVERDGVEVFRGRVAEEQTDLYNQTEYYCEGELAFLLDSIHRPFAFNGTAEEFFRQMIDGHNEQVEAEKRFTVGRVTAVDAEDKLEFQNFAYADTSGEISTMLLKEFGGFLKVRLEDGIRYIDYLEALDEKCSQKIELGVNLLDLDKQIKAKDIFTVLIPLGNVEGKRDPLTIESVNDGKDYLESAEGIARYGRIVQTHTWDNATSPAKLMELGMEKLQNVSVSDTITLTAVDMRHAGVDVDKLWLGYVIRFVSAPHGIDREDVCMKIDIDIQNPEKSKYVFGIPPGTLSDGVNEHTALAKTYSSKITETENSLILQAENIELLGKQISLEAEKIALMGEQITLKADKIDLEGYVTATELDAAVVSAIESFSQEFYTTDLYASTANVSAQLNAEFVVANTVETGSLTLGGTSIGMTSRGLVTGIYWPNFFTSTRTIQFKNHNGENESVEVVTGVNGVTSPTLQYETFYYVGGKSS